MTKKECFNCHNIKEGLTIDWRDEQDKKHTEFCCWDCSQNLIQQELDEKTAEWEKNKRLFLEKLYKRLKIKKILIGLEGQEA